MGEDRDVDEKHEPSLELPTLSLPGLGRRRRRTREAPPAVVEGDCATDGTPETVDEPPVQVLSATLWSRIPAWAVAIVTGLLVGVVGTTAGYGSQSACQATRGTASCGGAGFFFLVAIVVVMAVLGGVLLKTAQLTDPTSTSWLAVGITCVVVLVGLLDVVGSGWMFLVIPVVGAAAFVASQWLTTRFGELDGVRRE